MMLALPEAIVHTKTSGPQEVVLLTISCITKHCLTSTNDGQTHMHKGSSTHDEEFVDVYSTNI